MRQYYHAAERRGIGPAKESKRKESKDSEINIYYYFDDKYVEFLKLCLKNLDLDILPNQNSNSIKELSPEQIKREYALFNILISLFERGYLVYEDQPSTIRKRQWPGWEAYIVSYLYKMSFQRVWAKSKNIYDDGFVKYMEALPNITTTFRVTTTF